RVYGRVTLVSGTLLAAASDLATALVQADGGTLQTLGAPDRAGNLLANDSFEDPSLDANTYKYVSVGGTGIITAWGTATAAYIARCYPTEPTSTWISGGSVPDANHVLIVQRHGSVTQSFQVATSGYYQLAFDHFRRRGFPPHLITPSIDGKRFPPILTVHDQFDTAHYTSVPVYLAAGTHNVGFEGCGTWYDSSTMIDLAIIAPPSATQPCRALGADSSVTLTAGGTALLNHAGNLPLAFLDAAGNVAGPGTWSASAHAYAYDTAWQRRHRSTMSPRHSRSMATPQFPPHSPVICWLPRPPRSAGQASRFPISWPPSTPRPASPRSRQPPSRSHWLSR
ncbi:MAG TPA: hypothetical protein PLW27_11180, partial [Kiritimatiellia bacterium]|nr:hypothetical protein [Kiritimatiellia bacterium]